MYKINQNNRPTVLCISGYDPSAGAGITADIKTLEKLNVYGIGACTALTIQNDITFKDVQWVPLSRILDQIAILDERFSYDFVKIGLIESLETLEQVILHLTKIKPDVKIIWDPIIKSSTGFNFHSIKFENLHAILKKIYLITPNLEEISSFIEAAPLEAGRELSQHCNVLLKGGHGKGKEALDVLFSDEEITFGLPRINNFGKHGSGCVLSSAIAAFLSKEMQLVYAIEQAKLYTHQFISSNDSLLGYHENTSAIYINEN